MLDLLEDSAPRHKCVSCQAASYLVQIVGPRKSAETLVHWLEFTRGLDDPK